MHTLILLWASLLGPWLASSNYSVDLAGAADSRPGTWGTADSFTAPIAFHPPHGYRVRILRIRGDLTAWARVLPDESPVAQGTAGVLVSFQTTARDGSARCTPCADNTLVYLQGAVSGPGAVRVPFDARTSVLLEPDSILRVTVASWLNTTGKPIHLEPTFTVVYRFEEITQ